MTRYAVVLAVFAWLSLELPSQGGDERNPRSPFEAVRWHGDAPEVRVRGEWQRLLALDGLSAAAIVAHCRAEYDGRWRKRFEEDIEKALARMGHLPGDTVALTLEPIGGGRSIELPAVAMTEENRRAIWAAAQEGRRNDPPPPAGGERKRSRDDEPEYAKLAPFTSVRWSGATPEVEVDGRFFELVAIDGVASATIVAFCEATYGDRARKRFSEDLVEVMTRLGHAPAGTVALTLARKDGAKRSEEVVRARMTVENRSRVLRANNAAPGSPSGSRDVETAQRVRRDHARAAAPEFRALAAPVEAGDGSRRLSRADAEADLDQLEWLLENRYSYFPLLALSGVDHRAAFDAVRGAIGDAGCARETFSIQVRKLLALEGDGHTRIDEGPGDALPAGYLPFLVSDADGRLAAFKPDRSGFVDADHPYLLRLDGVDAGLWLETAGLFVPRLSGVFHRRQSERFLREIQFLRRVRGMAETEKIDVLLSDATGKKTKRLSLGVGTRKPKYGAWPRTETRLLDGNVGYIRIAEMDADPVFLSSLEKAMADFRGTRALVIDVRGNGGGSRDALRTLFPYFMKPSDAPRVANVAKYRIPPGEETGRPEGYLGDRFLFPLSSKTWSDRERAAIGAFARTFKAEWSPASGYSDWHYLVLGPSPGGAPFHYDKPVAVLQDGDCFSATDIFLGAFKGWRNVTLVGTPSGGGSGRAKGAVLEKSGLALNLSSMASFRPDGKLYDRNGVEPDVVLRPAATDLVGVTDTVLAAARKLLD